MMEKRTEGSMMLDYCLDIAPDSDWFIVPESETARALPFHMTELGDFRAGGGYYVERDSREGYQLIYTIGGTGVFQTAEQTLRLTPGTVLIIHCPERHRYAAETPCWHNQWIHFGGSGAEVYAAHINSAFPAGTHYTLISVPDGAQFGADFRALAALAQGRGLRSAVQISNHLSNLLTTLLSGHLAPREPAGALSGRHTDIANAAAYIRGHYQDPLTLDMLAGLARLSKYHFVRLFKKQLGETPYEYLTNCRISRAKLLLRSTDASLDEIAEAVGYQSKSNFIAQFKALTGTTPARYRQESLRLL